MTKAEFIARMKAYAEHEAREAKRCREEWRNMAYCAYAVAIICVLFAVFNHIAALRIFTGICAIGWTIGARGTWRQGDSFARQWMELREEALRHAHDAENDPSVY